MFDIYAIVKKLAEEQLEVRNVIVTTLKKAIDANAKVDLYKLGEAIREYIFDSRRDRGGVYLMDDYQPMQQMFDVLVNHEELIAQFGEGEYDYDRAKDAALKILTGINFCMNGDTIMQNQGGHNIAAKWTVYLKKAWEEKLISTLQSILNYPHESNNEVAEMMRLAQQALELSVKAGVKADAIPRMASVELGMLNTAARIRYWARLAIEQLQGIRGSVEYE